MTQSQHVPRLHTIIPETSPRIGVPPTMAEMTQHAGCVNCASLDDMAAHFGGYELLDSGTWSWSYVRTAQARYLCLRAILATLDATAAGGTHTVKLDVSISDGTTTVASSDAMIPYGFKNEVHNSPTHVLGGRFDGVHVVGYVDLDALAATLTGSEWIVSVAVTIAGSGAALVFHGWEAPCFAVDDTVTGRGVLLGNYARDVEIADTPLGTEELITADEAAVTAQRTLVNIAWRQQVADVAETPNAAGTSYGALALLDEAGSAGTFATRSRTLPDPTTGDVPIRFRVLYRFSGGAGTETGNVRLGSGATGSPWATGALAYTTTWTWSAWVTAAHRSGVADDLALAAQVSAGGPTLWVAAVHVMEACAP